jgi:ATP-dependent DNA helicase PIF1
MVSTPLQPIVLSKNQLQLLDAIENTDNHFFITGKAGTGKTTILKTLIRTSSKKIVALATTGVAALNISGQTVHSFFGFPAKMISYHDIKKRKNNQLYKTIDTIIIDEVSMLRSDTLDHIDYFLKINRESELPFGGVQMIFFGDLFQLPPVVPTAEAQILFSLDYTSPYFFSGKSYFHFDIKHVELQDVFRQKDLTFIKMLDSIRLNSLNANDFDILNERYFNNKNQPKDAITLSPRKHQVQMLNDIQLRSIHTPVQSFLAKTTGQFNDKLYPTDFVLNLKVGAKVMLLKNDYMEGYHNGSIGEIQSLSADSAIVRLENGQTCTVTAHTWEQLKYKVDTDSNNKISTDVVGTFTQLPLRLAWAITIHKSQGLTYEKVVIDLGAGAFASGQVYVAMSRCTTLEGIYLTQPILPKDLRIDPVVAEYYFDRF